MLFRSRIDAQFEMRVWGRDRGSVPQAYGNVASESRTEQQRENLKRSPDRTVAGHSLSLAPLEAGPSAVGDGA